MKYKLSNDSHVKLTIYVDLQFLAKPVTTLTYFQRIPVQEVSPVYMGIFFCDLHYRDSKFLPLRSHDSVTMHDEMIFWYLFPYPESLQNNAVII